MKQQFKIGLVTSRGGHLYQLYRLKKWWKNHDRFWITFRGEDVDSLLTDERIHYAYSPESRNVVNAIKNAFLSIRILRKERPDILISCGAGIAPPVFFVAKLFGTRLIYIEPYDFIEYPSLSGRLVRILVDKYLVQHKRQLRFFLRAEYWGSTL